MVKYCNKLALLKCFIYNGIGLQKLHLNSLPTAKTKPEFESFKKKTKYSMSLNWTFSNLVTKINFLEVNIKLLFKKK